MVLSLTAHGSLPYSVWFPASECILLFFIVYSSLLHRRVYGSPFHSVWSDGFSPDSTGISPSQSMLLSLVLYDSHSYAIHHLFRYT